MDNWEYTLAKKRKVEKDDNNFYDSVYDCLYFSALKNNKENTVHREIDEKPYIS